MAGPQGRGGRLRARVGGVQPWRDGPESSTIAGAREGSSRGQSPALPEGTLRSSWSWGPWSASWVPRTQLPLPPSTTHPPGFTHLPTAPGPSGATWPSSSPPLCHLMREMWPLLALSAYPLLGARAPHTQSWCVLDAAKPSRRCLCKSSEVLTIAIPVLWKKKQGTVPLLSLASQHLPPGSWLPKGCASFFSE